MTRIDDRNFEVHEDYWARKRLVWAHRDNFDDENTGRVDALTTIEDFELGPRWASSDTGFEDEADVRYWATVATDLGAWTRHMIDKLKTQTPRRHT